MKKRDVFRELCKRMVAETPFRYSFILGSTLTSVLYFVFAGLSEINFYLNWSIPYPPEISPLIALPASILLSFLAIKVK